MTFRQGNRWPMLFIMIQPGSGSGRYSRMYNSWDERGRRVDFRWRNFEKIEALDEEIINGFTDTGSSIE